MSNPPRRSRPKKPARTIDLEATALPPVGYPGPVADPSRPAASGEAAVDARQGFDAEARLAEEASVAEEAGSAEPLSVRAAADPSPDDAGGGDPAPVRPLEGENPAAALSDEKPANDFDEAILDAAVPDFVTEGEDADRPSGPPPPAYDYTTTPSVPHDARGGGFGSVLGAAVLGAALALAGAGALQYAGYLPAVGVEEADTAPQFARIGDVQQVTTDLTALRSEVEQLRSAQAAGGTGTGATTADLTAVADRVTALEQRGEAPAAAGAVDAAAVDAARTAASAADAAAKRAAEAADAAKQVADAARAAAAEATQAAGQAGQTANQSRASAAQAGQTAATAAEAAEAASKAAGAAQQAAGAAQETAAGAQTAATAATAAIAAFEPRLAAIEAGNRQASVALSAAGLKAAIDRGGPFMGELETFAATAGASPAVETLRGFAAEGVPSEETLLAQWPDVQEQIAAILTPPDPNASVGDQILSGLGGLVKARPVAPVAPATAAGPGAALARLDAALRGGDLAGWLAEWQTLPQPAKDASQAFHARVDARVKTEEIVGETLNNAVKAGGQPAGTAG